MRPGAPSNVRVFVAATTCPAWEVPVPPASCTLFLSFFFICCCCWLQRLLCFSGSRDLKALLHGKFTVNFGMGLRRFAHFSAAATTFFCLFSFLHSGNQQTDSLNLSQKVFFKGNKEKKAMDYHFFFFFSWMAPCCRCFQSVLEELPAVWFILRAIGDLHKTKLPTLKTFFSAIMVGESFKTSNYIS